jgi:hypothetical protein
MHGLFIGIVLGATGGSISSIAISLLRRRRSNVGPQTLLEVIGAALAAICLEPNMIEAHPQWAFMVGVAWPLLCVVPRFWITKRVDDGLRGLEDWWQRDDYVPGDAPKLIRHLAVRWPTAHWATILRAIGLVDLTAEDLRAYMRFRSQMAKDTLPGETRRDRLARAKATGDESRDPYWLITRRNVPLLCFSIVGIVAYPVVQAFAPTYRYVVQALVIFSFLVLLPDPLVDERSEPDESRAAWCFQRFWCLLLASWIALYLVFFLRAVNVPPNQRDSFWEVLAHLANNLNTYAFVMCYLVMHDPPYLSIEHVPMISRSWLLGLGVVALISLVEISCYAHGWMAHIVWFQWIGGFAGGVGIALLVGRLESQLIKPPIWLIAALYFYAVLQGGMGSFGAAEEVELVSIFCALPLKGLLLLFVAWLIGTPNLASYMKDMQEIRVSAESVPRD